MKYKFIRNLSIIISILTIFTNDLLINKAYGSEPNNISNEVDSEDTIDFKISSSVGLNNISVKGLKSRIISGDSCKLNILENNEVIKNIIWKNSDKSNAIVNSDGVLIGIGNGKANIFAEICDENNKVLGTIELNFFVKGENKTGWIKNNETWYYIDSNTRKLKTGWLKDNGDWYCFDENGAMKTGWVNDHDNLYYLKPTGNMARGWFKDSGFWYYAENTGNLKHGWFKDHGNSYYFNEEGKMQTSPLTIEGIDYKFANNGELID